MRKHRISPNCTYRILGFSFVYCFLARISRQHPLGHGCTSIATAFPVRASRVLAYISNDAKLRPPTHRTRLGCCMALFHLWSKTSFTTAHNGKGKRRGVHGALIQGRYLVMYILPHTFQIFISSASHLLIPRHILNERQDHSEPCIAVDLHGTQLL